MNRAKWWPGALMLATLCGAGCIEAPNLPPRVVADMAADMADMASPDLGDMTTCTPQNMDTCPTLSECGVIDDGCGKLTYCGTVGSLGRCTDPLSSCASFRCEIPTITSSQVTNLPGAGAAQSFGFALAMWEDWLFVGDPLGASNADQNLGDPTTYSGRVDVFRREATGGWKFHSSIGNPSLGQGVGFGAAIAARDGYLVVGAPYPLPGKLPEDAPSSHWGHVTVYTFTDNEQGGKWGDLTTLNTGGNMLAVGTFGAQVLLTEDRLLVTRSPFNPAPRSDVDPIAEGGPIAVSAYEIGNGWSPKTTTPLVESATNGVGRSGPLMLATRGKWLALCQDDRPLTMLQLPALTEAAGAGATPMSAAGGCGEVALRGGLDSAPPEVLTSATHETVVRRWLLTNTTYAEAGVLPADPLTDGARPALVLRSDDLLLALHTNAAGPDATGHVKQYTYAGDQWSSASELYKTTLGNGGGAWRLGQAHARWGDQLVVSALGVPDQPRPQAGNNATLFLFNLAP